MASPNPHYQATDGSGDINSSWNSQKVSTLVNPDYFIDMQKEILRLELRVSEEHDPMATVYLKRLLTKPQAPLLDPSEPQDIPLLIRNRMELLKMFLEDEILVQTAEGDSIIAVIKAYRDETLEIKSGWTSYWCNGQMVRSLGPSDSPEVESEFVELYARSGKGRIWVEAPEVAPMFANVSDNSIFPPAINTTGIPHTYVSKFFRALKNFLAF